jgi:hypothetical protein
LFDGNGVPVVVWQEYAAGDTEIYVSRWDGQAWVEAGTGAATGGGISNNTGASSAPAATAVLDPHGSLIVAWADDSTGNNEIYVRRGKDLLWQEYGAGSASDGGVSNNTTTSLYPAMAVGTDGNPIVAWSDYAGGNYETYVKRWNGSAWVEMGAGSASGGGISGNTGSSSYPAIAIGTDGNPIITWHDSSGGDNEIYVKRWNGSSWVQIGTGSASGGGISNNNYDSVYPAIAIGPDGNPIITWADKSSGPGGTSGDYEIYARRWDPTSSSWVEIGTGSATEGGISNNTYDSSLPAIAIDGSGKPVIVWRDYRTSSNAEIYVRQWDGSSWVEMGTGGATVGGISNNAGTSSTPAIAIDADGNPIVAWQDSTGGNNEIYVRRWDPLSSSWVEMGTGSASGKGISTNAGSSSDLALVGGANPLIAWMDNSAGNYEIYVKRWDASAWVDTEPGSASGGGISNNTYDSAYPSLAVSPDGGIVMAWSDYDGKDWETFVRRWVSDAPKAVDLLPTSDTGISDSDYLTKLDNSSSGNALQFQVYGTASGATVTLYDGSFTIGSAIASGVTTTITTDGFFLLVDGTHSISVRQTDPGRTESPDSPAVPLTIDTLAPAVPTAPDLTMRSDSGLSASDNITNIATPTLDIPGTWTERAGRFYRLFEGGHSGHRRLRHRTFLHAGNASCGRHV